VSVSIPDFWKLLAASRLQSQERVQQLAVEFAQSSTAAPANAKPLAQWLVTNKKLSRYQATVLLAGRSGPFFFGDYRVHDRLEQGRFAGCFRAHHTASGHPVLLQFFAGPAASDPAQWRAIAEQARAGASVVSPFVQRTFEPVELPKLKFVVSEDLRGVALDERLATGPLPLAEACRFARQTALGLAVLHEVGRVHGDVRPTNFWLAAAANQPASVKLIVDPLLIPEPLDIESESAAARLAQMADFLAPELAVKGRAPDPLADIYALGCTLFTLLAGTPPFPGGEVQAKLLRHASEPIPPLEPLGVPPALARLVSSAIAKKPSARLQSAMALAEQLAPFIDPAALSFAPQAPPATLARYEHAIQFVGSAVPTITAPPQVSAPPITAVPNLPGQPTTHVASSPPVAPATEPALSIAVGAASRPRSSAAEIMRRRKQQQQRNMAVAAALLALLAIGGGGAAFVFRDQLQQQFAAVTGAPSQPPPAGAPPAVTPPVANTSASNVTEKSKAAGGGAGSPAASADDRQALWAAPTSGEPISFRCVPPEAQVFLHFRPSDLLASEEGQRVLAALGPTFAAQRHAFESASGFNLDQIEHLLLTLHNNDAKFPRVSIVVKTNEPFTAEQVLVKWGNPASAGEQAQKYYTLGDRAFYIPAGGDDERTFVMGEARDIEEVAAVEGGEPVVFPQIKRLQRTSDGQRHFTLIFFPQFLFNDDGEPLFAAERAKVRAPLAELLGDHLQAASISAHVGDQFYFELRMLAALDKEPYQLAQELRTRLQKVPTALEDYFVSLNPPPYWKKLSFRYPSMVRDLHDHLRIGVENDQAIANSVLPPSAAHNLLLGGELLVATSPGPAAAVAAAPAASGPKTIEDALALKTSYSFDSQSLEFAISGLADEVKSNLTGSPLEFAIKIIGADLEKDGITRNQTIRDFKQENQTVADILTALVRKANPITTVKDPSEAEQKLVWVVAPNPDNVSQPAILITTRAAAAAKKLTLPSQFVTKAK
jgi:eukaryotic-like serine/threonine-protein kinase